MKQHKIYTNDWIQIHPYSGTQPSDTYFVELANKLYNEITISELPEKYRKKLSLYVAAYLEDIISGLNLWNSFRNEHRKLYGKSLPFYTEENDYEDNEPNYSDICFIIWNTWQKALFNHEYINPLDSRITTLAKRLFEIVAEAYEEAPENEILENYFSSFTDIKEADKKLDWLFGHTYLTEPSMEPYIDRVSPTDRFIIPTGPLALFLHEWIDIISASREWGKIDKLYISEQPIPEYMQEKNRDIYEKFTSYTNGYPLVYLNGYEELKKFIVNVLKWKDDDNHTLPQMKSYKNFVLMVNPEKGLLLAKDICEYIYDDKNPIYNKVKAKENVFRLLTEETLCPPDLLMHCINNNMLPDLNIPGTEEKDLAIRNADFIARHSLLYYYRGD